MRTAAGQGTTVYQPQIALTDGVSHDLRLSSHWDAGAEYIAFFRMSCWVSITPCLRHPAASDGTGRTHEQVEIYYADEAVRGEEFAEMRATK